MKSRILKIFQNFLTFGMFHFDSMYLSWHGLHKFVYNLMIHVRSNLIVWTRAKAEGIRLKENMTFAQRRCMVYHNQYHKFASIWIVTYVKCRILNIHNIENFICFTYFKILKSSVFFQWKIIPRFSVWSQIFWPHYTAIILNNRIWVSTCLSFLLL